MLSVFKKNKASTADPLQSQMTKLQEHNISLQEECKELKKTISAFVGVKAAYEDEKNELVKEYESKFAMLKQQLELEKKSVAKKVNAELSTIGVQQFLSEEISDESTFISPEEIVKRFTSMAESPEKHEFFKKYEKTINLFTKQKNKER